jgi:hypothetical protein
VEVGGEEAGIAHKTAVPLQLCCVSDEKDKLKRESFECRIVQREVIFYCDHS